VNRKSEREAIAAIEREGALLVYPIVNRMEPASLWTAFYPRSRMNWSWDETADPRIVGLWHLRERLARSKAVVYGKWYKGRAVFFSRELFVALLAVLAPWSLGCSMDAREMLSALEENSPQTTKLLRQQVGLRGRENERTWTRSLQDLWERLLIVGTGEAEDGAFPSLQVGATRWIFEDLWEEAQARSRSEAEQFVTDKLGHAPAFLRHLENVRVRCAR
jgi:hypothetical protein